MTTRRRKVKDDSTLTLGQITRRWVKKKPGGKAVIAIVDTPKNMKKAVKRLKKGR